MDLFDLLQGSETARHMLMPNMRTACGRSLLEPIRWAMSGPETTCTACHEAAEAHGGISAWCRQMGDKQAPVKG